MCQVLCWVLACPTGRLRHIPAPDDRVLLAFSINMPHLSTGLRSTLRTPRSTCVTHQALHSVGLGRYANADALNSTITENGTNFSGGEKKRICLARALLRDTDVLIFDEPLANLDAETAERIEDLLLSIRDKTILIVSHQFTETKLHRFDQVVDFAVK